MTTSAAPPDRTPPAARADRVAPRRGFAAGTVLRRALAALLLLATVLLGTGPAAAGEPEINSFEILHNEDGVLLNYGLDLGLSRSVDDALSKGIPLFFVAEADVFRNRWYWRDLRVAHAVREWRIVFQPLTSSYRVSFLGLSQNYTTREEAFAAIARGSRWKIADSNQIDEGGHHYVEFSFRLDTSLLPRPLQIGIGGSSDWALNLQRSQRIN